MRRWLLACLAAFLTGVAGAGPSLAREIIESFDSEVVIARDGTLTVTETIGVVAEGRNIKRGIYRDFPTTYHSRWGARTVVPFDVVGARRDGETEPYHVEPIEGGVRVYIGSAGRPVSKGRHTYELTYTTRRQIGFFDDHDELYWNATGNFWSFPIERATAVIRLPAGIAAEEIAHTGYTGPVGSKEQALRSWVDSAGSAVHFETTAPLDRGHGLTVVALFPKGHVLPPSEDEQRAAFYQSNRALLVGGLGALAVLAYYLLAWAAVGRDPARGTIVPRFAPPDGMSPACMRHLVRMDYDHTCFATAVVSMAVKGFLRIEEEDGEFTLVKVGDDASTLAPGEKRIAAGLLGSGRFRIRRSKHAKIRKAIERFEEWLVLENEGEHFKANRGWLVPGVLVSIAAIVAAGAAGAAGGPEPTFAVVFVLVWLSLWTLGVVAIGRQVVQLWRVALRSSGRMLRIGRSAAALILTAVSIPFLGGEIMGLALLARAASVWMIPVLLGVIGLNALFYSLLKRPTLAGRRLLDEIEGFRMYLRTAEGDEIRRLKAPEPTPELYERYLPYAMALDVENEWAEQFSDVLEQAAAARDADAPRAWYHGAGIHSGNLGGLTSSLGSSLAGAVASASTAPGSSSGGGGGGSSGGGGGGGGGGGW